ncbi:hypothetical protein [Porphyrobacter sp. ULC335]|uniref:hypothetical protein n=1 Tax=Porphyrobacter sp. ULC335 TaxID=2854260 RepID=UPI00221EABC0|nr:hypothetical protein [Porphyrobacter sp. ULC335]UYV16177.1 hypothetical protein KVF90_02210 [Porphyrobacter sp. ULC335]
MYKAVFQNSKYALIFAVLTLISAVSMVGTSEDGGVVGKVTSLVEARRDQIASNAQAYAESQSEGDQPPAAEASAAPSVFGDYGGGPAQGAATPGSATPARNVGNPMTARLSPTATVVERGSSFPTGEPFISEREMTIEPE